MAEQLEQYLTDLDEIEGLPEELYDADHWDQDIYNVGDIDYLHKKSAYRYLAEMYLYMGKMEECLRVRTEWAAYCDRPDLVQNGNHGYYEWENTEFDKYGRITSIYYGASEGYMTYIYGESHDGIIHSTGTFSEWVEERELTYDSEGRVRHIHTVVTYEDGSTYISDIGYVFTGNNSFVTTSTNVFADGSTMGPNELPEQFYDKFGNMIFW